MASGSHTLAKGGTQGQATQPLDCTQGSVSQLFHWSIVGPPVFSFGDCATGVFTRGSVIGLREWVMAELARQNHGPHEPTAFTCFLFALGP